MESSVTQKGEFAVCILCSFKYVLFYFWPLSFLFNMRIRMWVFILCHVRMVSIEIGQGLSKFLMIPSQFLTLISTTLTPLTLREKQSSLSKLPSLRVACGNAEFLRIPEEMIEILQMYSTKAYRCWLKWNAQQICGTEWPRGCRIVHWHLVGVPAMRRGITTTKGKWGSEWDEKRVIGEW